MKFFSIAVALALGAFLGHFVGNEAFRLIFEGRTESGVELTKADCIETCIRILQNQSVFPDYHRNVQHCNAMFAEVESCRLAK